MIFLDVINRILRSSAIIRGDTDIIATFNDTVHNASLNVGIVAVQNELVRLVAEKMVPRERLTTGSITLVANQRAYDLPLDFIRFYGLPHFYNSIANRQIYEYTGGLIRLQTDIYNFATQYGQPTWWYWEPAATKQIGFFMVPDASGEVWTFDYEGSVMVTASSDTMPFHNDEENFAFSEMCARRFKYMFEDVKNEADIQNILERDGSYRSARATLYKLIKGQNPSGYYGHRYY